ncbi:putative m23 peptidase domain protein [Mycobacterium intracellulare 1956]|uniref:Putative m23 peptidase domain protein n=1 Tax=Mycobacterium intracellulare 1956 TaxID=1299331 RepID=X8CJM8_MYCIT|nr:putative m23 peptidase domain protein [Mycobacterium intracellulare 1956]
MALTLGAALVSAVPAAADDDRLDWPLRPPPAVTRAFDAPVQDWHPGHRGVDLAGPPVSRCTRRARPPWCSLGCWRGGRWCRWRIRGLAHQLRAGAGGRAAGQSVAAGTVIGTLMAGHPGCRAAACLHWGAMWGPASGAHYVDPLGLLRSTPIRLKPLRPSGDAAQHG